MEFFVSSFAFSLFIERTKILSTRSPSIHSMITQFLGKESSEERAVDGKGRKFIFQCSSELLFVLHPRKALSRAESDMKSCTQSSSLVRLPRRECFSTERQRQPEQAKRAQRKSSRESFRRLPQPPPSTVLFLSFTLVISHRKRQGGSAKDCLDCDSRGWRAKREKRNLSYRMFM
jgi:hypothetical protein